MQGDRIMQFNVGTDLVEGEFVQFYRVCNRKPVCNQIGSIVLSYFIKQKILIYVHILNRYLVTRIAPPGHLQGLR